jgi:hypothetical protein
MITIRLSAVVTDSKYLRANLEGAMFLSMRGYKVDQGDIVQKVLGSFLQFDNHRICQDWRD